MKRIITFKNTDDYEYFDASDAKKAIVHLLTEMERDEKSYMITIEEVEYFDEID